VNSENMKIIYEDPNSWIAPKWEKDFGDPLVELKMLKAFCLILNNYDPKYKYLLDTYEEGYMNVEIFMQREVDEKIAELNVVEGIGSNSNKRFAVFFIDSNLENDEIYFESPADGLMYFK